jgi:flagellar basal-body rod protein FlgF
MNVGLYQAAATMNAANRWQEVVAENLSAGFVPGFKKQDVSFSAVQSGILAGQESGRFGQNGRLSIPAGRVSTNFQQGELQPTDTPTDLALAGPGFFELQRPDGNKVFTRDGQFRLDSSGQLVSRQGYTVLGEGGPLQLEPGNGASLSISVTGEVSQGGQPRGRLTVVDMNDPRLLQPIGDGLFVGGDPALVTQPAPGTVIRQGFVESSNTSSAQEMAGLINAMRMHEAGQKLISTQDELMGRAISELTGPA